jgi:hypothetical protein|tara:strand:- start:399 stop:596 length:198 start_codon:yes stop_codon:yes gene_type:complete
MLVPHKSELLHLKLQAAMREHQFDETELKYLGVREIEEGAGNHYYLIANQYEVCVDQIEDFERVS